MSTDSSLKSTAWISFLIKNREWLLLIAILAGVYLTSFYNYLLFHSLVELFATVIIIGIFIITWNARRYLDDTFLKIIGTAFLFVGILEVLHTLSFKGMQIFQVSDPTNLPTQLWIATRYLISLSFVAASLLFRRKIRIWQIAAGYTAAVALIHLSIFYWHNFPVCYIEGSGLTTFKIVSEYVIAGIFLAAIGLLVINRKYLDKRVYHLMIAVLVSMIVTEITFTHYVNVYGPANLIGHLLMVISFYLLYKAIIETGLSKPFDLLFRNLKLSERSLEQKANQLTQANTHLLQEKAEREEAEKALDEYRIHLETLVNERTAQLTESNRQLENEIEQRKRAEDELRTLSNRLIELQEEERHALSRELHDQTGQSLTVLNLLLSNSKRAANDSLEKLISNIEESQKVVTELLQQVRAISTNLHPSMLDNIGLIPTLLWYADEFTKRTGIKTNLDHQGEEKNLPPKVRITAYRIIQESLTNIARYAGVNEAFIQVQFTDTALQIYIEDEGKGFDADKVSGNSSGIIGMRERALALDGSLAISSTPGEGTSIEVILPLTQD